MTQVNDEKSQDVPGDTNEQLALQVIEALRRFIKKIDEIVDQIGEKITLEPGEKERLQELLRSLKDDLNNAAKRRPKNDYEQGYFFPAVTSASVNLTVAINSHPINSKWSSCLLGTRLDISYMLHQLERQFPPA